MITNDDIKHRGNEAVFCLHCDGEFKARDLRRTRFGPVCADRNCDGGCLDLAFEPASFAMSEPNEKRSVPLTIWITEAERARLENDRQQTCRSVGGVQVAAVPRSCFTRELVLLGLHAFEQSLGKSESFPAHSPPAGKMQRRARGSPEKP